jgi:hypothetical protein
VSFSSMALFVVVVLAAYASVQSQHSTNVAKETLTQNTDGVTCLAITELQVNAALKERSNFSGDQIDANIGLVKAQANYLSLFTGAPQSVDPDQARQALQQYYNALQAFLTASQNYSDTIFHNPFPRPKDLKDCLEEAGIHVPAEAFQ